MFKLDRKLIVSASVAALVAVFATGCIEGFPKASGATATATQASIDGGVFYPAIGDKTGPYSVNTQSVGKKINNGRVPTANELKRWDTDVMADGTGLPEGSGSVADGEALYEAQCVMCHGDFGSGGDGYPALAKGNAYNLQKTLTYQRNKPDADGPVRVFGSYWPQASTLWWYIRDGMPHPMSDTLSEDETYALVAYILNVNEMEIDGELVDDEYVLDREKFLKIKMPNVDGFEPNIAGPNTLPGVRAYYANPANFGAVKVKASERCMTNCQKETAQVVYIQNGGISDLNPPMSAVRDLPVVESQEFNAKKAYEVNCAMCHSTDGMGAPVIGDKNGWSAVTDKGMEAVYKNGIEGINGMPGLGGSTLSPKDFKSVVDYIINNSK
jgi:cytochrome c